jgi:hypothetical protein
LWQSTSGQIWWWDADPNGAYETGLILSAAQLSAYEATFEIDLNQDGLVDAPPPPINDFLLV